MPEIRHALMEEGALCPFSVIWEIITPKEREEYAFLPHRESDSSAGKSLGMEKAESRPGGLQVKCISLHDLRPLPRMEAMIFHCEIRWYHGIVPSFGDGRFLFFGANHNGFSLSKEKIGHCIKSLYRTKQPALLFA